MSSLLHDQELQIAATTFFAKEHIGETCGSNGLPLTPNSIIIYGRAQILKNLKHPYLCQYLDIIRGKHERTIVVSQYCGTPLSECLNKDFFSIDAIKQIAFQLFVAMKELHDRNILHRHLATKYVLLQENKDIKVFNYGLFHMCDSGKLVNFPIIEIIYAAPEVLLDGPKGILSNPKIDIWSIGIILVELVINKPLWNSLKSAQRIRKILSLMHSSTSIFERIAREHNCYDKYQNVPDDLRCIIEDCLNVKPKNRPTIKNILNREIFANYDVKKKVNRTKTGEPFEKFTSKEFYHWWQLAGGDILLELKKQGVIRSTPPIIGIPNYQDYHLFLHLKTHMASKCNVNDTAVKIALLPWLRNRVADFYDDGMQKFVVRYKCLNIGGNYVEK